MTRTQRNILLVNGALGVSLTLLVVLADHLELLKTPERWFYDRRAKDCQYFQPPPSDRIAHVDIDQNALDTIGRWPWPRAVQAQVIEEIDRAGPRLIALDLKLSDPQEATYRPTADGGVARIDNDAVLAATLKRSGRVLVPLAMEFDDAPAESDFERALAEVLGDDLELSPEQAADRVRGRGFALATDANGEFTTHFVAARRKVMYRRISQALHDEPDLTLDALRTRLLPKADPAITSSPVLRTMEFLYAKARKDLPMRRFAVPTGPDAPPLLTATDLEAPLATFSAAASASGFVDYVKEGDGKVRRIPLFARYRDQVYPQMGLAIACELMEVNPATMRIERDQIVIPRPDGVLGDLIVPVSVETQPGTGRPIGAVFDIPYFGTTSWETLYDHPHHRTHRNHVPAGALWGVVQTRQAIASNNAVADRGLHETILKYLGDEDAKAFLAKRRDPEDSASRAADLTEMLDRIKGLLDAYQTPAEPSPPAPDAPPKSPEQLQQEREAAEKEKADVEELKYHQRGMQTILTENQRLLAQLERQRADLREKLGDRAVLVGWVAGGLLDYVPTTIHDKCPGVVVHGLIADTILTHSLLRRAPPYVTRTLTLLFGLATTAFVLFLSPVRGALAALALLAAYFAFNGLVLYDYFGVVVGVAGPIAVMLVTWLACQLYETVVEKLEKSRITARFSTYVDPALVDFVIEHPEAGVTSGQEREMTVVFTDLAGFTTISEALKENVIPLLNDYLGLMSSIIKRHNGFVNKFLGDGIMFFYNAPRPNPDHAGDAVATVLEMQEKLVPFNEDLKKRGLPAITMRAGIVTGTMVVGDAGGEGRSDYTVIGDNVNLSARLESANKATDTKILMHARTAELLGQRYLVRPVARLQVKGKTEGVDTAELICRADLATEADRKLALLGRRVFNTFVAREFADCLAACQEFERALGKSKLIEAYRELAEQYLNAPPGPEFNGEIVLHEK